MDPQIWAIVLLFVSLCLLFAEVLIPSGGLIFFLSLLFLGGALWSAWDAWWASNPVLWWLFLAGVIVLLPASVGAAIYVWPHTPIGRMMEPPTEDEVTPYVEEQRRLEQLVGQYGETVTPLTPAGIARVSGQRVHCFSEGMIVGSGEKIKVLAVRGNRLLVRQVTPEDSPGSPTPELAAGDDRKDSDIPPLDFDLPAS